MEKPTGAHRTAWRTAAGARYQVSCTPGHRVFARGGYMERLQPDDEFKIVAMDNMLSTREHKVEGALRLHDKWSLMVHACSPMTRRTR